MKRFPRLVIRALLPLLLRELLPGCGGGCNVLRGVLCVLLPVKICVVIGGRRVVFSQKCSCHVMVPPCAAGGVQEGGLQMHMPHASAVGQKGTMHQLLVLS